MAINEQKPGETPGEAKAYNGDDLYTSQIAANKNSIRADASIGDLIEKMQFGKPTPDRQVNELKDSLAVVAKAIFFGNGRSGAKLAPDVDDAAGTNKRPPATPADAVKNRSNER